MPRKGFTEEQIALALRQAESCPAFIVMKAANKFLDNSAAPNLPWKAMP